MSHASPRTVVVTGGGTGIGRAVALRFAEAGDDVIVTGRRSAPLKETVAARPDRIRAVPCDHAQPAQLRDLLADLPPRIDVLVNNAGGNTDLDASDPAPGPDGLDALADQWRANLAANVLTAVLTTEALSDRLADGGSVVSVGSIAAETGSGAYGAAKAALASWNLAAASALGQRGITANVVAPGYIADTEFFRDRMTAERRDRLVAATRNGRVGEPGDVATTVQFLASGGARHVTGQVLHVNGGAHPTR